MDGHRRSHENGPSGSKAHDRPRAHADHLLRSLLAERQTRHQTLKACEARVEELRRACAGLEDECRELRAQLHYITNLRRYHHAERMAKLFACVKDPRGNWPMVARKVRSLRPGAWAKRLALHTVGRRESPVVEAAGVDVPGPVSALPASAPIDVPRTVPAPHFRVGPPARSRRVNIVIHQFFNQHGEDMFFGGAERYLIELARVVDDMGFEPAVYQSGAGDWVRHYNDMKVTALDTGGDWTRINEVFHERVDEARLTIYLAFFLASPHVHKRSIGISHGVFWDQEHFDGRGRSREEGIATILEAMENVATMVTVDTSTTNWVRGTRHELAGKFFYVPNFVDTEEFRPDDTPRDDGRVVVLYPRRLCDYRGFWLVHDVLSELIERHPNVDFRFVGKADQREEQAVRDAIERYPGRVEWFFLPPERMVEAYRGVDVVLVPTVNSEGTSLSCLEAQASGIPVIVTNVGGLTDLVLHDHNGLLIEPNPSALSEAVSRLAEDPKLRARLARTAREVASTFSLERWRRRWMDLIALSVAPWEADGASARAQLSGQSRDV